MSLIVLPKSCSCRWGPPCPPKGLKKERKNNDNPREGWPPPIPRFYLFSFFSTLTRQGRVLAPTSTKRNSPSRQCSIFTGMRLVLGDILISFGVVWYSGMRKWYAGISLVVAAVGVVPGAKPCKSAGITRVYPGFSRYTRKIPGILPILPILPPRRHSDSL